ncbi:MAG: tetratricopeptide repeat protein [Endomicrobia bacterium]|nr:tetratricopeptide repeat protein [Endomicrobiia bacterium]
MKKFVAILCSLLLLVIVIIILSVKPKKIFFPREYEIRVFNDDYIEKKIEELSSQLKGSDTNIGNMVELGIYYFIKGQNFYDKSINLLYDAWNLGSTDIRIFYYLGCMYEFLKLYKLAKNEYIKFLNNVPNDVEVLIRLGNVYYNLKEIERAKEMYLKTLKIDKDNIVALSNLGYIYYEDSNLDAAQDCLMKVLQVVKKKNIVAPKNVNYFLGKIFFDNGNYETAKMYFELENKKYPDNTDNAICLIKVYYELKDYVKAYELTNTLIEIIPQNKELKTLKSKLKKMLS